MVVTMVSYYSILSLS